MSGQPMWLLVALALAQESSPAPAAGRPGDPLEPFVPVRLLVDLDGDGLEDLVALTPGHPDAFLRNQGDGSFHDASESWGLGPSFSRAVLARDLDGDGPVDLLLTTIGNDLRLLRGTGVGFVDATASLGLAPGAASDVRAVRVLDLDRDGALDLFVERSGGQVDLLRGSPHGFGRVALELPGPAPSGRPAPAAPRSIPSEGPLPWSASGHPSSAAPAGPAFPVFPCAASIVDQAGSACLEASSQPALGSLFPLSRELFVEAASGEIGLGTTQPQAALHVRDADIGASVGTGAGSEGILVEADDAVLTLASADAGTSGSAISLLDFQGGVLQDNWSLYRRTSSSGSRLYFSHGASGNWLSNPVRMVLDGVGPGSVGIGVSVPDYALHVAGQAVSGIDSVASGFASAVNGGQDNQAAASFATVAGGRENLADRVDATVGGGALNQAAGIGATVSGGIGNVASGYGSSIVGGVQNAATGTGSFAAGYGARAVHDHTFVWAGSGSSFESTAQGEFLVDAPNGVGLGTALPEARVHVQTADLGATVNPSGAREGLVVESTDAVLSLYSADEGLSGSAIALKEWESGLSDTWGVYRTTSSSGSELNFSYGSHENWTTNPSFMTIEVTGEVGIGTTNPGHRLDVAGQVRATGFINTSDARLKHDVRDIEDALTVVRALRGVSFAWDREQVPEAPAGRQLGFLAQEVRAVLPAAVHTDTEGSLAVSYVSIVPLLVEALDEQAREIERLGRELEALRGAPGPRR